MKKKMTRETVKELREIDDMTASIAGTLLSKYDENSEDCKKLLELENNRREARNTFEKQHAKDEYDRGFSHGWLIGLGGAWLGFLIGTLIVNK